MSVTVWRRKSTREDMTTLPGWSIGSSAVSKHQPDGVEENDRCKILWDMTIQCDHIIEARRPENDVVKEQNTRQLLWILPRHVIAEKYQDLKRDIY